MRMEVATLRFEIMKTEQDLRDMIGGIYWDAESGDMNEAVSKLKEIQLDAFKAGMEREQRNHLNNLVAIRMRCQQYTGHRLMQICQPFRELINKIKGMEESILSAADNIKMEDLG